MTPEQYKQLNRDYYEGLSQISGDPIKRLIITTAIHVYISHASKPENINRAHAPFAGLMPQDAFVLAMDELKETLEPRNQS